jgi:hypothetical protein
MRSDRGLSTASTHSETFGASFARNFPVDGMIGSYHELCTVCDQHTRRFERVYNF